MEEDFFVRKLIIFQIKLNLTENKSNDSAVSISVTITSKNA